MTCDQVWPLLEAFTAHELGWGTAWRVRRHLAACPACASELAATRVLDNHVRAWRDVSAPAGLQSRIAAALLPVTTPRRPVAARRIAAGFAGVVAASAVFFWLVPGQPGRPNIAFADVEQAMQRVRTASYNMNTQIQDAQGHPFAEGTSKSLQIWLRRTPAADAYLDRTMLERHLLDNRGGLDYSRKKDLYLKSPLKVSIAQQVETMLRQLMGPMTDAPDPVPGPSQHWTMTPWQQKKVTLNGNPSLKFTRTVFRTEGQRQGVTHINIWVDAGTLHVVHIEDFGDAMWMAPGYQERAVIDNFRYNEPPPPGVFDWSPPPGAKVQGHW